MTGTSRSNSVARRSGTRGELDALAEGLPVSVSRNMNLLDGELHDVKTALAVVRDAKGVRSGRFRFYREQHEQMVERDAVYHFRLAFPDKTVKLCEVPARKLKIVRDGTLPWTKVCG